MLKPKLQSFGYLMQRADSFEKTLMLGKIEGRRRRGWKCVRCLDCITDSMDIGLDGLQELDRWTGRPGVLRYMGSQRVGQDWTTEMKLNYFFSLLKFQWPFKNFLYNLEVTFHVQLLQNIGNVPCVVHFWACLIHNSLSLSPPPIHWPSPTTGNRSFVFYIFESSF